MIKLQKTVIMKLVMMKQKQLEKHTEKMKIHAMLIKLNERFGKCGRIVSVILMLNL